MRKGYSTDLLNFVVFLRQLGKREFISVDLTVTNSFTYGYLHLKMNYCGYPISHLTWKRPKLKT